MVANARWENDDQPYFDGETEPCINGMVVVHGAYFGVDVDPVVDRLVDEQTEDGGWNCEAENGSVPGSFHTTIRVLEGLLLHELAGRRLGGRDAARRRGEAYLLERHLLRRKSNGDSSTPSSCSSRTRPAGTSTCFAASSTSGRPATARTRGSTRRSTSCARSRSRTAPGRSSTRTAARSRSRWRTATAGPAAGTRSAPCGSSAGTTGRAMTDGAPAIRFPDATSELTHILVVADPARSRRWYEDVLGAEVYRAYDSSVVLRFLGAWLLLVEGGDPTEDKPT